MNTQEAYEKMRAYAATMTGRAGEREADGLFYCSYRSSVGPCLIGALITDEEAIAAQGRGVTVAMAEGLLPTLRACEKHFLLLAQISHDELEGVSPEDFGPALVARLDEVAACHNLEVVK